MIEAQPRDVPDGTKIVWLFSFQDVQFLHGEARIYGTKKKKLVAIWQRLGHSFYTTPRGQIYGCIMLYSLHSLRKISRMLFCSFHLTSIIFTILRTLPPTNGRPIPSHQTLFSLKITQVSLVKLSFDGVTHVAAHFRAKKPRAVCQRRRRGSNKRTKEKKEKKTNEIRCY